MRTEKFDRFPSEHPLTLLLLLPPLLFTIMAPTLDVRVSAFKTMTVYSSIQTYSLETWLVNIPKQDVEEVANSFRGIISPKY